MRLFFKLALSLSVVFAFLAGTTALVLQATIMSRFEEVEDQVSIENVKGVAKTVRNQEKALLALAADYGRSIFRVALPTRDMEHGDQYLAASEA